MGTGGCFICTSWFCGSVLISLLKQCHHLKQQDKRKVNFAKQRFNSSLKQRSKVLPKRIDKNITSSVEYALYCVRPAATIPYTTQFEQSIISYLSSRIQTQGKQDLLMLSPIKNLSQILNRLTQEMA